LQRLQFRWQPGGVDAVGEGDEHAFGCHAEGGGDEFRVEVVETIVDESRQ